MFLIMMVGHLANIVHIFVKSTDPVFLLTALPWFINSAGPIMFDIIVSVVSVSIYKVEKKELKKIEHAYDLYVYANLSGSSR